MSGPLKYHEGEIAVQKRAGAFDPADLESNGLASAFDSRAATFLGLQPWAAIAALDGAGVVWTSLLHGPAGFLQVEDARTLLIHAALSPGDPLSDSFRQENEIGLLILDPRTRRRMRINGRAQLTGEGALRLTTREVFNNCPKYIQRREVIGTVPTEQTEVIFSSSLIAAQRKHVTQADTFFIGSRHAQAGIDCSHRGGQPGFVHVLGERRLAFPDYSGNNMFQTLGNLSLDSRAGLLFLDFDTGDTLQLTGTATIVWDAARVREWPGAHRLVEFEIGQLVAHERAFPLRWRLMDYSPFNPK
jgi:predicted pyridoxine 5'-phosphate oxidase superfamily flavin-nucleotide-binding protein